jgi:L,D-peptidoglycan transpeptidase YkuD (ErfK/YbiS/YcfS/YnhG family)
VTPRDRNIFRRFSRARRRWKIIVSLLVLGVVALIAVTIAMVTAEKPPVDAYDRALKALSSARKADADIYAKNFIRGAESRMEEAHFAWQIENLKWSPLRDYSKTRTLSLDVIRRAGLAERRAVAVRDSLKTFSSTHISRVSTEIRAFEAYYDGVPLKAPVRRDITKGDVVCRESRSAYERGDYIKSTAKIQEAEKLLDRAVSSSEKFLRDYMANLSTWKKWARETIAWSASRGQTAIVVDKMGRMCRVYQSGKLLAQYPVELGPNWIGSKQRTGDKATPEGRYHVSKKKGARQTKYHRALEIDYPNQDDLKLFQEAKRRGEISAGTRIGNLIEIHGEGGRGEDWTEGCVALRNDHMERLFQQAAVGTPVTIVGALEPDALEKNNHARNNGANNKNGHKSNGQ